MKKLFAAALSLLLFQSAATAQTTPRTWYYLDGFCGINESRFESMGASWNPANKLIIAGEVGVLDSYMVGEKVGEGRINGSDFYVLYSVLGQPDYQLMVMGDSFAVIYLDRVMMSCHYRDYFLGN